MEARTPYELVEGMRDETVEKITLRRHVELPPGNFSLPTIRDGRTLTVTGLCDAAGGERLGRFVDRFGRFVDRFGRFVDRF